jgi:hypothetical protein
MSCVSDEGMVIGCMFQGYLADPEEQTRNWKLPGIMHLLQTVSFWVSPTL